MVLAVGVASDRGGKPAEGLTGHGADVRLEKSVPARSKAAGKTTLKKRKKRIKK